VFVRVLIAFATPASGFGLCLTVVVGVRGPETFIVNSGLTRSVFVPFISVPSVTDQTASSAVLIPHLRVMQALEALRLGRAVLVQDDEDRENEADLVVAASRISRETMATLIRDGSGIVCLCITPAHAQALRLKPMVEDNRTRFGTAFTASIEAAEGISTGVSAIDRVTTVQAAMRVVRPPLADSQAFVYEGSRRDIVSPGHVFPLVARAGGVLERKGHTEASVDLARWAGLEPAGVLCELMNPDGTMAVGADVTAYSTVHGLVIVHIEELIAYAKAHPSATSV
jgi:3,4-dihydroxy 2-butanone 4-phosphate synthase